MSSHSGDSDVGYLGESSYDLLTDSTLLTDEEDEATSSVASFDDHHDVDDDLSLADTESLSAFGDDQPQNHDPHPIPSFNGLDKHHAEELDMSGLRESIMSSPPNNEIYFEEPDDIQGNLVAVSTKLHEFSDMESAEVRQKIPPEYADAEIYATVHQTMALDMLVMDEPLRVLYVGSAAASEEITKKIGAALAAGCSNESCANSWDTVKSPKYSVVSVSSFGSRSMSPEVELVDTSGLEIVVDTCTSAQTTKHVVKGYSDTISLWLNNNRNVLSYSNAEGGIRLECQGWKLPHLAIVFCSDDDTAQARSTRIVARQFLARHNVPTMVISQSPLYGKKSDSIHVDPRSLHVCIESPNLDDYDTIHKRMPVDLKTFLNINPRQLNRNLACLTGLGIDSDVIPPAPVSMRSRPTKANFTTVDLEKIPENTGFMTIALDWLNERIEEQNVKSLAGMLLTLLVAGMAIGVGFMMKASPIPEPVIQPFVHSQTSTSLVPTTTSTILLTSSVVSTSTSSIQPLPSASNTSRATLPSISPLPVKLEPEKIETLLEVPTINQSNKFQIRVIGSNHIMVHPPQSYLLLKKAPRLHVHVTRGGETVPAELSKLFEGVHSVYTLKINEDEAWGQMIVTIWTVAKPIIKEELFVDFGTQWLQFGRWAKSLEKKKLVAMDNLEQTVGEMIDHAKEAKKMVKKHVKIFKGTVSSKKKEFSEEVKEGVSRVVEQTRSRWLVRSRESRKAVRKAQKQAKNIWTRAEKLKSCGRRHCKP